jgi:6-phosphogluconate dehydrogenase (decarboxylating)
MGAAMARNLAAAGLPTMVWDRTAATAESLAAAGLQAVATAPDAVRDVSVVITMLPTAAALESVIFDGGVAEAFAPGAVWAQMGTIGVGAAVRCSERLRQLRSDVLYVDAPVSGSKGPAETGQLLVLGSGPAAAEPVVRVAVAGCPVQAMARRCRRRARARGCERRPSRAGWPPLTRSCDGLPPRPGGRAVACPAPGRPVTVHVAGSCR